jgi:hypothetical protein
MADIIQDDRYLAAKQGDGNFVVYRKADMKALWDRWTYEALLGQGPAPTPSVPAPAPALPVPFPPTGHFGRLHYLGDGFRPRIYSYYANAWVNPNDGTTHVFASGPTFFAISADGSIQGSPASMRYAGETECWSWDLQGYIYLPVGDRILRVNPFTGEEQVVMTAPAGYTLWQQNQSDDGQVHTATLKDASWRMVGTIYNYRGRQDIVWAEGELNESIVTKCGEFAIIQEKFGDSHDNRIIELASGREIYRITDAEGAVGHCDTGHGIVIGEDNFLGACVVWDLRARTKRALWHTWNMGHVSFEAGRLLSSDSESLTLVDVNNASMQHVISHGGRVTADYDTSIRANLSPCGRRATYMINGTSLFVVEL